ncbi:hypothetical protein BJV78DRAFT_1288701 [Lactifluus subvellereus]|nr:hypothetical protein BJV78DRAFT_1288701 [Lactifluus subvellereus]
MALNTNHGAQGFSKSQFSIQRAGSSNDVNSQANQWQTLASTLPFRHPDRAVIAHNIATYHFSLYKATRQKGDLDQAVESPASNRLNIFNALADALHCRFEVGGRLEDNEDLISLLRHVITIVTPGTDDYRLIASKLAKAWETKYEETDEPSLAFFVPQQPLDVLTSRFERSGDLNDIKDAATLYQESLDLMDEEHPERMWVLMGLATSVS